MSRTDIIKVIKVVIEGIVTVTRAIGKEWGEQRELEDKERIYLMTGLMISHSIMTKQ